MELSINFEIPVLGGRALRPFIAVWIEDSDKFPCERSRCGTTKIGFSRR
jgi:hypothetical protein